MNAPKEPTLGKDILFAFAMKVGTTRDKVFVGEDNIEATLEALYTEVMKVVNDAWKETDPEYHGFSIIEQKLRDFFGIDEYRETMDKIAEDTVKGLENDLFLGGEK